MCNRACVSARASLPLCVHVCVRVCLSVVRARVRAFVRACVPACLRACVLAAWSKGRGVTYSHLKTPDHILKRRAEVAAKKAALRREIALASFECPTNVHVQCNARKTCMEGCSPCKHSCVSNQEGCLLTIYWSLFSKTCVFARECMHTFTFFYIFLHTFLACHDTQEETCAEAVARSRLAPGSSHLSTPVLLVSL